MGELQTLESQQLAVQVDVANKYPRDLTNFVDDVYNVVVRDTEFAMTCIYCVPVGKDKETGSQTFSMGPSVRLSEEMQKYWKHLRLGVNCEEEPDKISVDGIIMDCQNNNGETKTAIANVSGWSDRRKELKLKAMQSCMKRDLRISIMGKAYADELVDKIITGIMKDKIKTWNYTKEKYASIGVHEATILEYFHVGKAEELTKKQIYQAVGMFNFLKENGKDANYLFGNNAKINKRPNVSADEIVIAPNGKKKKADPEKKEFESIVLSYLSEIGHTKESFAEVLIAEFSIEGGIQDIPANLRASVIDLLENLKSEQPGA
jgi:hypothetical protein